MPRNYLKSLRLSATKVYFSFIQSHCGLGCTFGAADLHAATQHSRLLESQAQPLQHGASASLQQGKGEAARLAWAFSCHSPEVTHATSCISD